MIRRTVQPATTGLTDADGELIVFFPHDFRRIFVTDAIMNGLPPHIAQVICGHKSLDTTMVTIGQRSPLAVMAGPKVGPMVGQTAPLSLPVRSSKRPTAQPECATGRTSSAAMLRGQPASLAGCGS
ncbi:site-specific integrase [Streptomyces sp. NBC_00287]|uniref:site-specific integrase n=1 Tax=Streptomyces sp. NBC_00287 TaxID=2975702 RepID=UPI002E2E8350|nr:site-specific integrase [Streptomyces sp. NBC_00287]